MEAACYYIEITSILTCDNPNTRCHNSVAKHGYLLVVQYEIGYAVTNKACDSSWSISSSIRHNRLEMSAILRNVKKTSRHA